MEVIFWIIVICVVLSAFGSGSSSSRRSSSNSTKTTSTSSLSRDTLMNVQRPTSNVQRPIELSSDIQEKIKLLESYKEKIQSSPNFSSPFLNVKYIDFIIGLTEDKNLSIESINSGFNNGFQRISNEYEKFERFRKTIELFAPPKEIKNPPQLLDEKEKDLKRQNEIPNIRNTREIVNLDKLNDEQLAIKNEIEKRNIKYLVHFTRLDNVKHILEVGLLGREALSEKSISYHYNDQYRLDNIPNGICCSISFPNYKMFWGIRKNQENQFGVDIDKDWVILRLKPDILWEKKAYFCRYNAASNQERFNKDKMNAKAFKAMFEDLEYVERNQLNIPDNFTTNPQAEVVFIEKIEPEWIIDICKKNGYGMDCYKPSDLNTAKYENETLFKPRSDYQYWTKH
ncbi:DarT ssDNA thymidine ADP-ribosyltransferase family protein [Glaesserella parasuis]|uniref:DarT ssDNA thymidine ADP-ribosyltransferase family protein n=1 Tax=Glaesserella parasuis TaxID=738 RepID=UPI0024369C61|nr:DarT ssDNA thymidine ADP-ribosyltransferase family protein [Glaesserella parasuis]MDG6455166.1 DarT ssDNA thymidine ADP-ribosyltransferase family protein [Glaesserella parasuis]MDP0018585.1 DarT ssDNA thymidine ADP-ribosyltransferase family protein [Glaesserella parasuis]MDP0111968.1 DarT ssDNA thymidine ADP-ribosyltransferase family protein [Glaesserella parasuis]